MTDFEKGVALATLLFLPVSVVAVYALLRTMRSINPTSIAHTAKISLLRLSDAGLLEIVKSKDWKVAPLIPAAKRALAYRARRRTR